MGQKDTKTDNNDLAESSNFRTNRSHKTGADELVKGLAGEIKQGALLWGANLKVVIPPEERPCLEFQMFGAVPEVGQEDKAPVIRLIGETVPKQDIKAAWLSEVDCS